MERLTLENAINRSRKLAERHRWNSENTKLETSDENANEVYKNTCIQYANQEEQYAEWLEELKSYKDLEEQGLFVRLPCPIGVIVWDICGMDIRESVVSEIECSKDGKWFLWANEGKWLGELNNLVFLTREEAEKKLEEMKKNGE